MVTNLFSNLEPKPDDPILGISSAYRTDPRPEKVNLSVGMYLDDSGEVPLFRSVAEAEKRLLERKRPHGYGPMEGNPEFNASVKTLVFGDSTDHARIATLQTLGGTGALQVGSAFAYECLGLTRAVVSNPTWGNHIAILDEARLGVAKYRYYDAETQSVDYTGLVEDLKALPEKTLVVLHACCHNPTGVDLTLDQWKGILEVVEQGNLVPFLDMAYQGFGEGLDEDPAALRLFAQSGINFLAATSSSKNFGLYGERVGALHVVASTPEEAETIRSILKALVRCEYSNPPAYGGAIVAEVLNDPELFALWKSEVATARERILAMRAAFAQAGKACGADLSFALRQKGMFSYTGLTKAEMVRLREEFAVYGVENGRICVAGLTSKNVEYAAKAFAKVLADR